MARIQLENISKAFGKVQALDGISLDVKDKEFFVLFGPAGAGKTTILNCIAGIVMPEEGVVKFDDQIMNLTDSAHRNVAMVFENYALYPQMTVYDNMASALRSKLYKADESVIKERIQWAAKIMKMENLLERLPSQLSNGQKQRVAMGRALVRNPNVFLMDEPLAHLDAKLRNSMRTELKEMQANLGSTCIYVTHDFMEAMALGDRIAIIKDGRIVSDFIADDLRHATQKAYRLTFDTPEQMTRFLIENQNSDVMQISETDPAENTVVILTDDQYINQIIDVLSAYSVSGFEHQKETLEDYFMKYYKEDKNFGGVFQK